MVGENNKVVIVTGGSSGIGRCTASALKENGCIVYEFSRRNIPMEGVTHLSVDVTDEDAVNAAVQQVIQKERNSINQKSKQGNCDKSLVAVPFFRINGVLLPTPRSQVTLFNKHEKLFF